MGNTHTSLPVEKHAFGWQFHTQQAPPVEKSKDLAELCPPGHSLPLRGLPDSFGQLHPWNSWIYKIPTVILLKVPFRNEHRWMRQLSCTLGKSTERFSFLAFPFT
jgi:hypothetical protein